MGDVGSGFLGFLFGALAFITHSIGVLVLWSWLILLGVFLVDATFTLLRRIFRKERIYQAHRSHAYQHAARRFGSHLPVTISVGLINMLWLLPLALASSLRPSWGPILVTVAWAPLIGGAVWFRAGTSD